jgi:hypothetical protein
MCTTTNVNSAQNIIDHFHQIDADSADAGQYELTIRDSKLSTDIDLSKYPPSEREEIREALFGLACKIDRFKVRAEDARLRGDDVFHQAYSQVADQMSAKVTELAEEIEAGTLDVEGLDRCLTATIQEPQVRQATLQTTENGSEPAGEASSETIDDETGAAATEGDDDPSPAFEKMVKNPDQAVESFERDPKAFFETLKTMDSEERGQVMTMVQNRIQANNRLMSMLTNFQKAQHDTQKAVISNLRV